jgi:Probable lipoprotein LpqN
VTLRGCAAVVAILAAFVAGCGSKSPDYSSIWTTSSTTTTTSPTTSQTPMPIAQYLESVGVTGEPIAPSKLTDLTVSMPRPPGWVKYSNPNLAPGTEVIAKYNTYPTAMLMVFKLNGDFDTAEAIRHGYVDAEVSQNFTRLNASTDDFRGFPSAMIEGSYDLNGQRLHSWNRVVIATGSPPANQRYLLQLTITTQADKAAAQASDIESIIEGFTIAAK